MKILEYEYQDVEEPGWKFDKVKFNRINLLVGDTATGKSRLLNTVFNLGRFATRKEFKNGIWRLVFEHAGTTYQWIIRTEKRDDERKPGIVASENLWIIIGNEKQNLIERDTTAFRFRAKDTPKLSLQEASISLLREEDLIKPVYEAFSIIQRRLFDKDELSNASGLQPLPMDLIAAMERKKDLQVLFQAEQSVSINLFVLSKYFKSTYEQIVDNYTKIFPFIQEARVSEFKEVVPAFPGRGQFPVFTIKERGSKGWIPITELSSGMLKVLLILTDLFIMPSGGVYILDEYENSLGVSAIDFFSQFVLDFEKDVQFILTSHHPYIINEIPAANWYVFHRKGMHVSIKFGAELTERFGKSKQQAFIQLINDPFYTKGVE